MENACSGPQKDSALASIPASPHHLVFGPSHAPRLALAFMIKHPTGLPSHRPSLVPRLFFLPIVVNVVLTVLSDSKTLLSGHNARRLAGLCPRRGVHSPFRPAPPWRH